MKSFVIVLVIAAAAVGPALANECPTLQAQIDAALSRRSDPNAAIAKQLAAQALALHQAGKHAESVAKYAEAARAAGITLQHKPVAIREAPDTGAEVTRRSCCFRSGRGIGAGAAGMHGHGQDLQLTQYDDRGSRATFYTTGMAHLPPSATGTWWELLHSSDAAGDVGGAQAAGNELTVGDPSRPRSNSQAA